MAQRETHRLTKRVLDALKPRASAYTIWDAGLRGFGVKIHASGSQAFVARYNVEGRRREVTLGRFGPLTVDEGRELARRALGEASKGNDPLAAVATLTIQEALALYQAAHLARLRQGHDAHSSLRRNLAPVLARNVTSITRADLANIVDRLAKSKPYAANRALAYAHKFFGWCVDRGHCEKNPASGLTKPHKERARDRVLGMDELVSIWRSAEALGEPWSSFLRVLILTSQRRSEVAHMRRDEVDLAAGEWTLPADRTKNGKPHTVHLSSAASALIAAMIDRRPGAFVFSTTLTKPIFSFSGKLKDRLDEISGVSGWRLHDFRRTFATQLADQGVDIATADRILNHSAAATMGGVLGVYQRAELLEPRRRAMDLWAGLIDEAVNGDHRDIVTRIA